MKTIRKVLVLTVLMAACPIAAAQFTPMRGVRSRALPPAVLPGDYNVLMIVLDDVGTDKLPMYAENDILPITPRMDELRAAGILFTHAYVNPVCSPTRAALITGRYGFRTGMGLAMKRHDTGWSLPDEEVFLPEVIRDALAGGSTTYATAAFGKWHLALIDDHCHAVRNGYDFFQGSMMNNGSHFSWNRITATAGNPPQCLESLETSYDLSVNRVDASNWIAQQTGPFFAYWAPNPPHKPQLIPPFKLLSEDRQFMLEELGYEEGDAAHYATRFHWRLLHDVVIEAIDTEIGNLLDNMAPEQRARTVTVLMGDNGSDVGVIRPPQNSLHGKGTLYNLGTRVPFLVSGALVQPFAGGTCDALVGAVDLWATLANIMGISNGKIRELYPDLVVDSISFLPLLRSPGARGVRKLCYSEWFTPNGPLGPGEFRDINDRAINNAAHKYIRNAFLDLDPEEELYNIGPPLNDWDEAIDLGPFPRDPDDLAALNSLRDAMISLSGP